MEYAYSILTFSMAALLALYAGILALSGDPEMIPRHYAARMKNRRQYARTFALVIFFVALSFAASGLAGLTGMILPALLVLALGIGGSLWFAVRVMRKIS